MISRRTALASLAVASAAPALARGLAMTTAADRLRVFMMMRGALDDRLVIGFLTGRYFGVVDGATTPLFGLASVTFTRFRARADGGYDGVSLEQAYFLDAAGGWLKRFANPYTGRTVEVPTGGYPPARIVYTPGLEMLIPGAPPGQTLKHQVSDFHADGANVWLTETIDGVTAPRGGGAPLQYHETVGLHARAADLAAPGAKRVPCETSYTSIKGWRPWLDMAGHPGETVSVGQGAYGAAMADLPAPWLAAARVHRPELLSDPAKLLDPLWRA